MKLLRTSMSTMSMSFASRQRARIMTLPKLKVTFPHEFDDFQSIDLEGTPVELAAQRALDEGFLVQNVVQRVKVVSARAQVFVIPRASSEPIIPSEIDTRP